MLFLFILIGWVALEIYVFILLGDAIGYLATIFLLFALTYIGIKITLKLLVHHLKTLDMSMQIMMGTQTAYIDPSDRLYSTLKEKLSNLDMQQASAFIMDLRKRCLKDQGILMLFYTPGFLTDIFAFIFLIPGVKSQLLNEAVSKQFANNANGFGRSAFKGKDPYGKSARDLEKEAEAFIKAQQGDIPTVSSNAEKATLDKMKSHFQAEKEIKDAKYEEIKDD